MGEAGSNERGLPGPADPHPWESRDKWDVVKRLLALLPGPLGWALTLQGGYSLVTSHCHASLPRLRLLHGFCLALCGAGILVSMRMLAQAERTPAEAPHRPRNRFLALAGLWFGFGFLLVVLSAAAAAFVMDPCQP